MAHQFRYRERTENPLPIVDRSHLSRRFGPEMVHYGSGSSLNRASFLRTDVDFLRNASRHPEARFIMLNNLDPLMSPDDSRHMVARGFGDLFGHGQVDHALPPPFTRTQDGTLAQFEQAAAEPLVVFLGLEEGVGEHRHPKIHGRPWFAVDVTPMGEEGSQAHASSSLSASRLAGTEGFYYHDKRDFMLEPEQAAIYTQARTIMDWNRRNKFCAACSRPTIAWDAGYRRLCVATPSTSHFPPCPIGSSISNISFPRTDPVMIAAVVSADGQRILLGSPRRGTTLRYINLAGFVEPGESVEDAVRREVWEEAGVRVGRVVLHSTQPWPYPNSLMIGAIAQARDEPGAEDVDVSLDEELESAKWFGLDEVREILRAQKKAEEERWSGEAPGGAVGNATVAPVQAIGNRLLTAVVMGFLDRVPDMEGL